MAIIAICPALLRGAAVLSGGREKERGLKHGVALSAGGGNRLFEGRMGA
jgi:hypothetical protein